MKHIKLLTIAALIILSFGILAACGSQGENTNTENSTEGTAETEQNNASSEENEPSEEKSKELSGEVLIDGSSTVFPIMEGLTYEYNKSHPSVELSLNASGSGGGFKKSTVGEIDLSNASRPIKPEEQAIADENGIELHELEIAYDGLSVVVSQQNDFIENITIDQLRQIFLADNDNTKWSDINPEWPEENITIYSPGHDSGTFDYFNEVILEEKPMKEGENVTLNEDDNLLVQGIQNDPYAIGYFGYAYYLENKDTLKVLGIDNGDGEPVKPNGETIQNGTYTPLSRPLFTYVNVASLEKPQVYDFVKFTLNNAGESAEHVGYVALPEEKYQAQLDKINDLAGK